MLNIPAKEIYNIKEKFLPDQIELYKLLIICFNFYGLKREFVNHDQHTIFLLMCLFQPQNNNEEIFFGKLMVSLFSILNGKPIVYLKDSNATDYHTQHLKLLKMHNFEPSLKDSIPKSVLELEESFSCYIRYL